MSDPAATAQRAQDEARVWSGSAYYDEAERWMHVVWGRHSPFLTLFQRLDLAHVLELACGHGRHAEHVVKYCFPEVRELHCADILPENLEFTRERLQRWSKLKPIHFHRLSGVDFHPVADAALTSIFCFDAMVHFHADVVARYLVDTARVLRPAGLALYHHSNYSSAPESPFGANPHARAHMSRELFAELAARAGLQVLEQRVIPWGGQTDLDCLTLVQRP